MKVHFHATIRLGDGSFLTSTQGISRTAAVESMSAWRDRSPVFNRYQWVADGDGFVADGKRGRLLMNAEPCDGRACHY